MRAWLAVALRRSVVRRAAKTALLIGTILIAINHGDALLRGEIDPVRGLKMLLTVAVPYLVSTAASVAAIRDLTGR
ncbi:MAG: nitrate/nitrite transporter NrtS [Pseudomonadota bacterium]|nr:nitrate/nitrite transporter NrtS [Pseudomonadota bacterium]